MKWYNPEKYAITKARKEKERTMQFIKSRAKYQNRKAEDYDRDDSSGGEQEDVFELLVKKSQVNADKYSPAEI